MSGFTPAALPRCALVMAGGTGGHIFPGLAVGAALRARGVPAEVSQTAGTFVCNHVFYALQHALAGTRVRSGFVHLPYLPEQAAAWPGAPGLPLATMVEGVREVLRVAATHRGPDLREPGGATD